MKAILLFLEITPNVHILFSSNLLVKIKFFLKKKNQHGQFK